MAIVQIVLNNTLRYYGSLSAAWIRYSTGVCRCNCKKSIWCLWQLGVYPGLAQGCQPIWGFNYGAGNYVRVRHTYKRSMQIALAVGGICFGAFKYFQDRSSVFSEMEAKNISGLQRGISAFICL